MLRRKVQEACPVGSGPTLAVPLTRPAKLDRSAKRAAANSPIASNPGGDGGGVVCGGMLLIDLKESHFTTCEQPSDGPLDVALPPGYRVYGGVAD